MLAACVLRTTLISGTSMVEGFETVFQSLAMSFLYVNCENVPQLK